MDITYKKFTELTPTEQRRAVEAMLFAAQEPLSAQNLADIFSFNSEISAAQKPENQPELTDGNTALPSNEDYFAGIIEEINTELLGSGRPYEILKTGGGYTFATRREFGEILQLTAKYKFRKKLSQAALETLAIIAWKQPVSKPEIEQIRGINSSEIVNSLLEKELITTAGKKDLPGRPIAYSTTQKFLQLFGINSLDELPKLREIDEILAGEENSSSRNDVTLEIGTNSGGEAQN